MGDKLRNAARAVLLAAASILSAVWAMPQLAGEPAPLPAAAKAKPAEMPDKPSNRPAAASSAAAGGTAGTDKGAADLLAERRALYERIGLLTGTPWHLLAAVDQYERTMARLSRGKPPAAAGGLVGIRIERERWAGPLNPDKADKQPASIRFFKGIGRDGDGDGLADAGNPADVLYTMAVELIKEGGSAADDMAIGVWAYYKNPRAVERVMQFSRIYADRDTLDLAGSAFPVPPGSRYSYRSTFGFSRSWGGRRVHEGTDIFAGYGVPVRSTCYGIVETKGWNPFGGWRIGIRDLNNLYHYYAHLSGFARGIAVGGIVAPGQTLGWVGSSGYGKPGTQGKFPPHLHYGLYRDRGWSEYAFDPYPLLKRWETEEMRRLRRRTAKK